MPKGPKHLDGVYRRKGGGQFSQNLLFLSVPLFSLTLLLFLTYQFIHDLRILLPLISLIHICNLLHMPQR